MFRPLAQVPSLTTGQVAVTASPLLVVSENTNRLGVVVTNLGPATVFIGTTPSVSIHNGFALGSAKDFEMDNPSALYVVAAGTGSSISYMEESA